MSFQHPDSAHDANGELESVTTVRKHNNRATDPGEGYEELLLDSSKAGALKRREFINNLLKCVEDDNLHFLQRQKDRIERHVFIPDVTKFKYLPLNKLDFHCIIL